MVPILLCVNKQYVILFIRDLLVVMVLADMGSISVQGYGYDFLLQWFLNLLDFYTMT